MPVRAVRRRHIAVGFTVALSTAAVGGCALLNPYVYPRESSKHLSASLHDNSVGSIGAAIDYADAWRRTWVDAAAQHSVVRNSTSLLVIPMSAVALFYGVTDHGTSDRIARLALGSAGLYAGNQFLTSSPRQALYIQGAGALSCAIAATRAFSVNAEWVDGLYHERDLMLEAMGEVAADTEALKAQMILPASVLAEPVVKDEIQAATVSLASAEASIAAAKVMANRSGEIDLLVQRAGAMLMDAVRSIVDFVNAELLKTEPDLQTLKTLNLGLGGLAAKFGGAGWPVPVPAPQAGATPDVLKGVWLNGVGRGRLLQSATDPDDDDQSDAIAEIARRLWLAREKLAASQSALAASAVPLAARMHSLENLPKQEADIKKCTPAAASTAIVVLPAGDAHSIVKGKVLALEVRGGAGIPRFQLLGTNTEAVAVAITSQDMGRMTLNVTGVNEVDAATAPTLVVSDGAGSSRKEIRIAVTKS